MTRELFGFQFVPHVPLNSTCFAQIQPQSWFYLSAPLMGIWNHIKSLQLGIELSRHKISEGTSMPLNTAPIINKLSERQFGRAVIGADFAQQIFQTMQRPLTSETFHLSSDGGLEFCHLNLNVLAPLSSHLTWRGTHSVPSIICTSR